MKRNLFLFFGVVLLACAGLHGTLTVTNLGGFGVAPGGNQYDPETRAWISHVTSAGGTFAPDSKTLANDLVIALKAKSYDSKIIYLMPLLGSNLAAARIPLRDANHFGAPTSSAFVDGDFSQATGLLGNGSSKRLDMPFAPGGLGSGGNGGMGFWANNASAAAGTQYGIGARDSSGLTLTFGLRFGNGGGDINCQFYWGGDGTPASISELRSNADYYGQRSSSVSRQIFKNGTLGATDTTPDIPGALNDLNFSSYALHSATSTWLVYWAGGTSVIYFTDGTLADADVTDFHDFLFTYLMDPTGRAYATETNTWIARVVAAGGTFESDSKTIANDFIVQLQAKSYGAHVIYVLPMLGANLAAARVPLRDSLAVGIATNHSFVDGDYSQATGLQGNGSSKYLDLLIKPSQLGTSNSGGMGFLTNSFSAAGTDTELMGSTGFAGGGDNRYVLDIRATSLRRGSWGDAGNSPSDTVSGADGDYFVQRSSSTSRKLYVDGSPVATNTTSDSAAGAGDRTIQLLAVTYDGGTFYDASRCAVAYMTDGQLSDSDVADFHTLLDTYLITATGK